MQFATRREEAGSLILPAPPKTRLSATENARKEVLECGGNAQLLEARLCQVTSSMRALLRSNSELEEALQTDPNDPDFLEAVAENRLTLRRQGHLAASLVRELQARGSNVDLEDDIEKIIIELNEEALASAAAPSSQTTTEEGNSHSVGNGQGETADSGGLYL
ncbi:expressed unknown protein [Seminavis robusta]|uniref:Uncharacterized protein n=1 Tax=Seminavis robusta TaxID=568900 RepID=A0A9N8EYF4_9STRA|nr:expressed unknown protein [Seminavis robusta]|eukprot:Sro2117_g315270.1 n/a (163) ;mRNA; f:14392-14880